MGDLGKIIAATSFEWLPKVQKIAKSGHTDGDQLISAENIEEKWHPELVHYCPNTPIILIGNQVDRREEVNESGHPKETRQPF